MLWRCFECDDAVELTSGCKKQFPNGDLHEFLIPPVLSDKYELQRRVGQGGMGNVYAAKYRKEDKICAVKVHAQDLNFFLINQRRFGSEIEQLLKFKDHKNIVEIFDYGQHKETNNTYSFLVMELLEGHTLRERLKLATKERTNLDLSYISNVFLQICEAVHYIHEKGVVHRDLTPGNIFIVTKNADTLVKILDFGIAIEDFHPSGSTRTALKNRLTRTGEVVGTDEYMAPEQLVGYESKKNPLDKRADIYTLGVILYEMLTGRRPFEYDSTYTGSKREYINYVLFQTSPLREFYPEIHEKMEAVVLRAMEKKPQHRYQTVLELANAFNQAVDSSKQQAFFQVQIENYKERIAESPSSTKELKKITGLERLESALLYNQLSLYLYNTLALDEATKACEKAIQLDPVDPTPYILLGRICNKQQNYQMAIESAKKALEKLEHQDPFRASIVELPTTFKRTQAHILLGQAYKALGDFLSAKSNYEEADKLSEIYEFDVLMDLIYLYLEVRLHQEVIKICNRVLKLNPDSKKIYLYRGRAYLEINEKDKALADFQQAIDLGLDIKEMGFEFGDLCFDQQQYEKAIKAYIGYLDNNPHINSSDWQVLAKVAHSYFKLGDYESAFEYYSPLVETENLYRDADIYLNFAIICNKQNYNPNANNLEDLPSTEKPSLLMLATQDWIKFCENTLSVANKLEQLLTEISNKSKKEYLKTQLENIVFHSNNKLGFFYLTQNNLDKSIEYANKAIKNNKPLNTKELASSYSCLGQAYYFKIKNNKKLTGNLLNRFIGSSSPEQMAIDAFNKAIELDDKSVIAYTLLGRIYLRHNNTAKTLIHYKRAIECGSEDPDIWLYVGNTKLDEFFATPKLDLLNQAIANYEKAKQYGCKDEKLHIYLADYYKAQKRNEDATACVKYLVELKPNNFEFHQKLADIYYEADKHQEACKEYQQALFYLLQDKTTVSAAEGKSNHKNLGEILVTLLKSTQSSESTQHILDLKNSTLSEIPQNNLKDEILKKYLVGREFLNHLKNSLILPIEEMPNNFVSDIFDNRYKTEKLLEQEEYWESYLATDLMTSNTIKLYVGNLFVTKIIEKQIKAASFIKHHNVVKICDWIIKENNIYVIEEYIGGHSLEDLLDLYDNFPLIAAIGLLEPIAEVIDEAHLNQFFCAQLNPSNIIISKNGNTLVVKLKLPWCEEIKRRSHYANLNDKVIEGYIPSRPQFISPELAKGTKIYSQTDIYNLALIFYKMITGKNLFSAKTPMTLILKHIHEEPTHPHKIIPDIPEKFSEALMKALAKNPRDRYSTCKEFIDALKYSMNLHLISTVKIPMLLL